MTLSSLLKPSTKPMTLRATGAGVNTIDLLPPSKTNCLSLYISYNSISSLENITQFKKLKELLMDFNEISRIEDLGPLSTLKNLTVLHIEGNPVCNLPLWDLHLLTFCPKLRVLNGQKTKDFLYSKSQIQHFLEIESKFHQFIIISKFVTKVLKLKIMDTNLTFAVAAKITQSSMFKDPNYNSDYANKLRLQCSKVNVEGYFSLMRRKLLAQHSKISELSKTAQVPSKTHTIIYDQIKLITDFDAFLESMQDLQDSSLQVVGIGSGPVLVAQPKQDQFILSRRSFQSRSERYSHSGILSYSNKQQSIKAENDFVDEEEEIGDNLFNSTNNAEKQEKIDNENFKNASEIDIELEAEINDENNDENDQNPNEASEIHVSKLSDSNQINIEVTTENQENNQQPSTAASVADRSIVDSIANIQSPQTAFSQSDANKLTQNMKDPESQKLADSLDNPDEQILAQDSNDAQSQDQNLNANGMLSEGSNSEKSSNLNDQESNKDNASAKSQNQENVNDSQSQSSAKSANSQKNRINDQKLNFNKEEEEEKEKASKDPQNDIENQDEAQHQSSQEQEDQKDAQSQSSKTSQQSNKQNQIQKASEEETEKEKNEDQNSTKENENEEEEGTNEASPKENENLETQQNDKSEEEEETNEVNPKENENLEAQQSNENEDQNSTEIHSPFFETEEESQIEPINQNKDDDQITSQKSQQQRQMQIQIDEEEEETNDQQFRYTSNKPYSNQEEEEESPIENRQNTSLNQNQLEIEIEEEEEEAAEYPEYRSTKRTTQKIVTISNEDEVKFDFEFEEEENDHSQQKKSRRVKKRKLRVISDIDTDYAQSLSDTDTPGKPILANAQPKSSKGQNQQQEEPFIFEKSRSKSSFKSYDDNDMSSSVSNGPRSILKKPSKTATSNETDEARESELTDENGYGENKVKKVKKTSLAISHANVSERETNRDNKRLEAHSSCFDACSDKSSDFNDFRLQTVTINLVPSSYGLLQRSFSTWKRKLRKRRSGQRPSQQFTKYIDLLNKLDSKTLEIKKEKKEQAKKSASASKYESQRGDQLRQISLKQELKRKIEHQKEINKALQKRLDQYVSENQSLQGFLDSPFEQNFNMNSLTMSYSQKSQSMKNKKKKKDSLTAQYCAMLREKK